MYNKHEIQWDQAAAIQRLVSFLSTKMYAVTPH